MSIQTGEGPIRIDADDVQFSYRGVRIALKTRSLMTPFILACKQMSDGSWNGEAELTDMVWLNDGHTPERSIEQYGGAVGFVRSVVLPALNTWLATLWLSADAPASALEQINAALQGIRLVVQADGTVRAEL